MTPDVSVVIPTFKRPEQVKLAVNSVLLQEGVQALVEIVVLDNDPKASAREVVAHMSKTSRWPIVYGHEPEPGVATARNTALRIAKAKIIMFIDDDQTAAPGWMKSMLAVQAKTNADLVFGPVQGRIENDVPHKAYIEARFSATGPAQSGIINDYYGCCNSMLKRARFFLDAPVFNPATNETGGEDDELYSKVLYDGGTIAWAADALVYEEIPPVRATVSYSISKAFAFGQGPTQTAWQHRDFPKLAYWMAVGLGQFFVYGLLCAFYWPINKEKHVIMLDKMVQGLGKMLWTDRFQPRFYGASAL
ncbi:MAG: family 2 glycosyl transferase [Robiginitomaculum sp.]|nr:MAG: family 2 glycosyl transferase [Robiginitomaculum sp.]